jgi:integrase
LSNSSSGVILVGKSYLNFVNSISSPESRQQYVYVLKKYTEFLGVSPDDLIKQDPKLMEQQIIDYIVSLNSRGMSRATKSLRLAAIVSFYSINDVILNRKKLGKFLGPRQKQVKDRPYTLDEVSQMLKVSDEKMKCIVMLLTSTGMRLGGLIGLKISSLQKIDEYKLYRVTVYENSVEEYICFTIPETAAYIDFYLYDVREHFGEKLKPESPLIRKEFNRQDPLSVAYPRPIQPKSYDPIIQDMLERAGIITVEPRLEGERQRQNRKAVSRTTGFRKMVNTTMVRCKVDPLIKEMLLGHHTGLEENYYRPEEQDLLNEYLKCVDSLTVNNEFRLQRQVEILTVEKSKVEAQLSRIDELYQRLGLT